MTHGLAASGLECLTHLDKDLVRCSAHKRDQLGAILLIHRTDAVMGLSVGRAVPIEVGSAGTPAVAAVLADRDLGIGCLVCAGDRTKLAADRQLPADVRLGLQKVAALAERQQVQRATLTGWKAWTVEKDAGAVDHPRLATRQFTLGKMFRMLLLGPATDAGVLLVLPLATLQLPDRLADSFLVLGVSKMGAQGAAAVVRPASVNTLTTVAIDAGPPRSEPSEVTAKHLALVAWIGKLDECARKSDQHFGHARQCMPAAPAVSVGDRARALLSQAGAPLSWTSERAGMLFACERVSKAAATKRQPQRAKRAI
jgi:hypothetical protein